MAGSAEAAVECIRTGLEEPSHVAPYLEPWLPNYDRIRDDPAFVALLDELEGAGHKPSAAVEQPE
jgi:hypothetical protein